MRHMPRNIHADPCDTGPDAKMVPIPTLPADEWWAKLAAIADRPLTEKERARAEKMATHNWTLRVVADALFGESQANSFFGPKIENDD